VYVYRSSIGPIKGEFCPMYPSCSQYGDIAIKRHGVLGILMTMDRLHRCGHDLESYERVIVGARIKCLDPVRDQ
jgi:putative component of membrane protein insertase Oxa1/YidC/SpoIIIJ protein YidD